jgi:hypothetical protein
MCAVHVRAIVSRRTVYSFLPHEFSLGAHVQVLALNSEVPMAHVIFFRRKKKKEVAM